jgi:adenylyltransferase/sulfurtransferase
MIAHITPLELKARLDAGARPCVLDVREAWELEISRLDGIIHIPMNEITARLGELDPQRETIVMCRSGGRSLRVAEYLASQGFAEVANLTGGILAWGEDVDPALRPY